MDDRLKAAFLDHIAQQAQYVLWANDQLQQEFVTQQDHNSATRIFFAIHAILTASGNISKALWGGMDNKKPKHAAKRKPLREALKIDDTSVLYPPLDVRNGFEHYDEKLEPYLEANDFTADCNVGPMTAFCPAYPALRHYDPDSGNVSFLGTTFNIPAVVAEVERILKATGAGRITPATSPANPQRGKDSV